MFSVEKFSIPLEIRWLAMILVVSLLFLFIISIVCIRKFKNKYCWGCVECLVEEQANHSYINFDGLF